jgi:hypothetical protein
VRLFPPTAPAAATCFRIRFLAEPPPGAVLVARFADPRICVATAEILPSERLPAVGQESPDRFDVLFIPAGAATPYADQQRAEAWAAKPDDPAAEPTIELVMRSDRILWRAGRALVQGAPERFAELLAGLVDFAFHEGELRALERQIDAAWPDYEADIPLTHAVGDADLARQPHVDAMTVDATRRRMAFARLERRLEKASIALPGGARRLVSELHVQAEILERMKSVDDRLEVFEDLYELANDRLCEYRYFRSEYRLEAWILLVLAVELVLVAWEVVLAFRDA